jgi:DNA-binding MarR family transcriptional regulator
MKRVSHQQFCALAEFRFQIRRFLHFSELAAKGTGIEPQQHQLMLAIRANEPDPASIGYLAERLLLRHHSVVGLVDRLEQSKLVKRVRSTVDRRSAQVYLTAKGAAILSRLSLHHQEELKSAIPALIENLTAILHNTESTHAKGAQRPNPPRSQTARPAKQGI